MEAVYRCVMKTLIVDWETKLFVHINLTLFKLQIFDTISLCLANKKFTLTKKEIDRLYRLTKA